MYGDYSTPKNPKLDGSILIDCIPQTGLCPNDCAECYYNLPGFYMDRTKSIIPSLSEARNKLVRVNSGHDSNLQKNLVLKTTAKYKYKFYNTSIPQFAFPGPIVFTCNGRYTDEAFLTVAKNFEQLMMVRMRVNPWNIDAMKQAIRYYTDFLQIPFTVTFMRYRKRTAIPKQFWKDYVYHKHILNPYWTLKAEECARILESGQIIGGPLVGMCGTLTSSYCRDCSRCVRCYTDWHDEHKGGKLPWTKK